MWLLVVATAVVLFVLERRRKLHALVPILVAAVASAGVWIMIMRTAALPRTMTPLHQKDEGIHRPLAISTHELFWVGDQGLVRAELPSLRITSVMPWQGTAAAVLTNVAWSGRVLLVTWHDGAKGHYAMAGKDGWVVPPRATPHDDTGAAAYWDKGAHAFVLGWRVNQFPAAEESFKTRHFTYLDEAGVELRTVDNVAPIDLASGCGLCISDGELVGTGGYSTCRTKTPITAESTWTCVKGQIGAIPECPSHFNGAGHPADWLATSGLTSHPPLPRPLAEIFTKITFDPEVLLRDGEVEPRDDHVGSDHSTLTRVDGGYVRLRHVDEREAASLGRTREDEVMLEHYDERGRLVAQNAVLRPAIFSRLVPMGDEVALVSNDLDFVARFRVATMQRIDPPDVVTALRERLERWGGPSPIFRALVVLALALGPLLPLVFAAWLFSRNEPNRLIARSLPRVVSVLGILALAALAMTISRYFYL